MPANVEKNYKLQNHILEYKHITP